LLPYNFGLEPYLGLAVYLAGILACLLSIVWKPMIGLYYLAPLIPLQTTRYRMLEYPLGQSVVTILVLSVALGLLRQRRWIIRRSPWTVVVCVYGAYLLASLFMDTNHLMARLQEWWDYITMPVLLFLVHTAIDDARQMKTLLLLMCLATIVMDKSFWDAIKDRDFSSFSRDLQEGGAMGYAGVQGMGAYNAQYAWLLISLAGVWKRLLIRLLGLALALFAANCVIYTFSRGAYVALLTGWLFVGVVKNRKLLLPLVVFAIIWTSVVPNAVRERIFMTYDPNSAELDHAAAVRVDLWSDAVNLFQENPLLGTGFHTYAYMGRVGTYEDTHNIYLKILVETGVVGLLLFLWLLWRTFHAGFLLFRNAKEPFFSALGLGLAAWMVCSVTTNMFGDRWTYLQVNGYLWIIAGMAARALDIEVARAREAEPDESDVVLEAGNLSTTVEV